MSVTGLCSICERHEARFSCPRCGAVVCEDHYTREYGSCVDCARGMGDSPGTV